MHARLSAGSDWRGYFSTSTRCKVRFLSRGTLCLLSSQLGPASALCSRDLVPCGAAHPSRPSKGLGRLCLGSRLHLSLRPTLLQQSRQLPPRSRAHAATLPLDGCCFWRTTCSTAPSRVDSLKCRNGAFDAVALSTKFRKNSSDLHDGSSDGYPNSTRTRPAKGFRTVHPPCMVLPRNGQNCRSGQPAG